MKYLTRRQSAFMAFVLEGVALPATLQTRHRFKPLAGSDLDRMRGDVGRIGQLFTHVMKHEREKTRHPGNAQG